MSIPFAKKAVEKEVEEQHCTSLEESGSEEDPLIADKEIVMDKIKGSPIVPLFFKNTKKKGRKNWITIFCMLCYFVIGGCNSIFSPILKLLEERFHATDDQIAWIVTAKTLGMIGAALLSMIIFYFARRCYVKKFHERRLVIRFGVNVVLISTLAGLFVSIALVPFFAFVVNGGIWYIYILHFFQGLFFELTEIGLNNSISLVWKKKVNVSLMIIHAPYALGNCVVPLLSSQLFRIGIVWIEITASYGICSLMVLAAVCCLLFSPNPYLQTVFEESRTKKRACSKECCGSLFVFGLAAIIKGCSVGCYDTYGPLINLFCSEMGFADKETLGYLTLTFWSSFALGRFVNIPVIALIKNSLIVLVCNVFLLLVSFILLFFVFSDNFIAIWILTAFVGLFVAPMSPLAVGICKNLFDVTVTELTVGIVYLGSTSGALFFSFVENALWKIYLKVVFVGGIGCAAVAFFVCVIFVGMKILSLLKLKR